ncbi:MAG: ornithine cyclodeaminase family protein [Acidobacteriota bacterium]
MSSTLLLTGKEIARLMSFDDYLKAVENAFLLYAQGRVQLPGVVHIGAENGAFHIKSAALETNRKYVAVKVNGNFPQNPKLFNLPTIQGVIILFDGETGSPLALMDSIEITINRTGAATALAAKYLARPDSATITICGCGNQGRISLLGIAQLFPLKRAFLYDINPRTAEALAESLSGSIALPILSFSDLKEAVRQSDIIVTCTTSRSYFIEADHVPLGAFIAAVGADSHDKQELQPSMLAASKLVVDILEQCAEIGELHHAIEQNLLNKQDVYAELGEIIAGRKPGRTSKDEIVIFDSTGTAIQDVVSAAAVYEKAEEVGAGHSCSLV